MTSGVGYSLVLRAVMPPLILGGPFAAGFLLHWLCPVALGSGPVLIVAGVVFVVCGSVLHVVAWYAFHKAGTPILPGKEPKALVTTGPFRLSRNPLYLALTLLYAGFAIAANVLWPLLLLPAVILLMNRLVIKQEEQKLQEMFGEKFIRYKARARRWI